jgi:hypothetical protein
MDTYAGLLGATLLLLYLYCLLPNSATALLVPFRRQTGTIWQSIMLVKFVNTPHFASLVYRMSIVLCLTGCISSKLLLLAT